MGQLELIPEQSNLPEGFLYRPDFISPKEEHELVAAISGLQFTAVVMRGVAAKRRTAHFGRSYDFETFKLGPAPPLPQFLRSLRDRAAALASHQPHEFAETLVSEYPAGAAIGWHRDAPPFGVIAGISLMASCTMKFRPWPVPAKKMAIQGKRPKPLTQTLEPRSAYVIAGAVRTRWQHHIPPTEAFRYSITFRTLPAG